MQKLTPEGNRVVSELSQRFGFSQDAVTHMLIAVLNGNGSMAQFSHSEFAGSGQWMRGGMLMLGDMFNQGLKGNVDSLCNEISNLLANQPGLIHSGSFQSQSQGGGAQQNQSSGLGGGPFSSSPSSLFVPDPEQNWWPESLGAPNSLGSQDHVRYAYFSAIRRLAVKTGPDVWVYDTLDHQIGGFSQQQGGGSSITFTSQYGTVSLMSLPVVSRNGQDAQPASVSSASITIPNAPAADESANVDPRTKADEISAMTMPAPLESDLAANSPTTTEIIDAIARLGELKEKGVLTEEEFSAKKGELLSRL